MKSQAWLGTIATLIGLALTTVRGDDVPGCREPAGFAVSLIDTDSVVVHHQQLFGGETAFWL